MADFILANIPEEITDICPKCGGQMRDGDLVKVTWNGEAESHINCPDVVQAAETAQDGEGIPYSAGA